MRVVLDFAERPGQVVRRVFEFPSDVWIARRLDEVMPLLDRVSKVTRQGHHVLGFLAYEAAGAFDSQAKTHVQDTFPLACFAVYGPPSVSLESSPFPENEGTGLISWKLDKDPEAYERDIDAIRQAISRGETYQINHTLRAHAHLQGSSLAAYERLLRAQRADYGIWMDCGAWQILSLSPELFFRMDGKKITTRPMKGTSPRGSNEEMDRQLREALQDSAKNRAENLMIVDLLRNDLSRICQTGSVQVHDLFQVETYPTLFQMTSQVTGHLRDGISISSVFQALFPSGSITGAPKLKAMEWIRKLETTPRGAYCGALGWVKPGGDAIFNVGIRTLQYEPDSGSLVCGLGGGITWDSRGDEEYSEIQTKARFLQHDSKEFDLLETMKLDNGEFWLKDYHLKRLRHSARQLGFPVPETSEIQALLQEYADQFRQGRYRVRLRYGRGGTAHMEGHPLEPLPDHPVRVVKASFGIPGSLPLLNHKTTSRDWYERAVRESPGGAFDVLLWNTDGELTEFTRGNLVVETPEGLFTPPVKSGLLPGTCRQYLLDRGEIQEQSLRVSDLEKFSVLWFINSVRGWVQVTLD